MKKIIKIILIILIIILIIASIIYIKENINSAKEYKLIYLKCMDNIDPDIPVVCNGCPSSCLSACEYNRPKPNITIPEIIRKYQGKSLTGACIAMCEPGCISNPDSYSFWDYLELF